MKKIAFFLIAGLFLTACTSINSTVDSLYMKRGRNISYAIDVKTLNKNNEYVYFKSYIKGDKWKTMFLEDDKIHSVYSYDGGDKIYKYDVKTKKLTESPVSEDMRRENALNIVGPIVYWKKPAGMSMLDAPYPKVVSTNESINNQPCTMIKFGSQREACISNESGLALYHRFQDQVFYLERAKKIDISDNAFKIGKE